MPLHSVHFIVVLKRGDLMSQRYNSSLSEYIHAGNIRLTGSPCRIGDEIRRLHQLPFHGRLRDIFQRPPKRKPRRKGGFVSKKRRVAVAWRPNPPTPCLPAEPP